MPLFEIVLLNIVVICFITFWKFIRDMHVIIEALKYDYMELEITADI